MKQWAICDNTGVVLRLEDADRKPAYPGLSVYQVNPPVSSWPKAPGEGRVLTWNGGFTWDDTRSLADAKEQKWNDIKAERDKRLAGTFSALGHVFQIDLVMVPAAAFEAKVALDSEQAWERRWTLANDSRVWLSAADMVQVGQIQGELVDTIMNDSQDIRELIDAAATLAEVDAVTWDPPT